MTRSVNTMRSIMPRNRLDRRGRAIPDPDAVFLTDDIGQHLTDPFERQRFREGWVEGARVQHRETRRAEKWSRNR